MTPIRSDPRTHTPVRQVGGHGRIYAGQTADQRDEARRDRIIAATREIVGSEGYRALKIERICAVANVSTRNFYLQYASKEDAFLDMYDTLTNESVGDILAALDATSGRPLAERVPSAFLAYLSHMFDDLKAARIAFVEVVGRSPRVEEIRLRYREGLISLIEAEGSEAVARGEISPRNFRFVALSLIGSCTAIAYDWMVRDDRQSIDELKRQLTDLAVKLLTS